MRNWEEAKKTIFEYSVTFLNLLFKQGEVTEKELNEKKLRIDILAKNVYIIDAPNYPKTPQEIWRAFQRLCKRLKEEAYALAYSNCEHLVNYVLTGKPESEQINNASAMKKFVIDSIDHCIINGRQNMFKLFGSLLACFPVKFIIDFAVQAVINEAKKWAMRMGLPIIKEAFPRHAKNLCKYASKQMGRDPSCLLNTKPCMKVAEEASKKALKRTIGTTFLVTGAVELVSIGVELRTLNQQIKNGYITQNDCNREYCKKISGAIGATAGSVGLGVLGQAFFPVPFLGYALGNAVGNFCGRWFTSAFVGYCFDRKYKS